LLRQLCSPSRNKKQKAVFDRLIFLSGLPTGPHGILKIHRKSMKKAIKKARFFKTGFFDSTFCQAPAKSAFFRMFMPKF
jgi:hypothetical protein